MRKILFQEEDTSPQSPTAFNIEFQCPSFVLDVFASFFRGFLIREIACKTVSMTEQFEGLRMTFKNRSAATEIYLLLCDPTLMKEVNFRLRSNFTVQEEEIAELSNSVLILSAREELMERYFVRVCKDEFFAKVLNPKNQENVDNTFEKARFPHLSHDALLERYREPREVSTATTTDKYEASISSSSSISKERICKVDLSKFRLSYLFQTPSQLSVTTLKATSSLIEKDSVIERIIIDQLFLGDHNRYMVFMSQELKQLYKYRNAVLYKCLSRDSLDSEMQLNPLDEEYPFQPYFVLYVRQLMKRIRTDLFDDREVVAVNGATLHTSICCNVKDRGEAVANVHLSGHSDIAIGKAGYYECPRFKSSPIAMKASEIDDVNKYYHEESADPILLNAFSFIELKAPFGPLFDGLANHCKDQAIGEALCLGNMKKYYQRIHSTDLFVKGGLTDLFVIFLIMRLDDEYFITSSIKNGREYLIILLFLLCDVSVLDGREIIKEYQYKAQIDVTKMSALNLGDDGEGDEKGEDKGRGGEGGNKSSGRGASRKTNQQPSRSSSRIQQNQQQGKTCSTMEVDSLYEDDEIEDYDIEMRKCRDYNQRRIKELGLDKENQENERIDYRKDSAWTKRQVLMHDHAVRGLTYLSEETLAERSKQQFEDR